MISFAASSGLTGGLAAPLVAAGAATIIGSAGAAALGSTAGIAVMASLFGAAGAGLTGKRLTTPLGHRIVAADTVNDHNEVFAEGGGIREIFCFSAD